MKEGQGATEGEETLPQEAANSATNRKEEEEEDTGLESAEVITAIGDVEDSVMGQPLSLEGFDSERKEASQEGERVDSEGITLSLEPAEGLSAEKGLTECVSTPGDVPCTPLIDCGDVIEGPESAVPCLLIEGLREGEPPPDTNSLEQNQETAVRDYAIEQQQGSAPETACHSGSCAEAASPEEPGGKRAAESCHTFENEHLPSVGGEECTSDGWPAADTEEEVGTEPSCGMTPSCRSKAADQDPEMTRSLSSEDDGSFRSIGSSTTDVFHPTRDVVSPEDQECPGNDTEECQSEEPSGCDVAENHDQVSTTSEGFPLEQADVATAAETDCGKGGTHSESQWSACLQTMEALTAEGTGEELEELDPQSKESPSLGPQSGGTTAHEVNKTECAEAKDSNSDGELGPWESEVTARVCGDCPSVAEEHDGEGDLRPGEAGDESVVALAETSEDVMEPERDDSKVTVEESRPHDEELRPPQSECDALPPPSSNVENAEPVEEPRAPEESCQNSHDAVDGASPGEIQALEDSESKESEVDAEEKETGTGEKADCATIHRDREASFHQPCNALHSESSASPSLPSRTSSTASCPSRAHRDSGSDTESFLSADAPYDSVFRKNDEPVTGGDSTSEVSVSCSSTDDTASVCPSSSSLEGSQGLECIWSPVEGNRIGAAVTPGPDSGGGGGGGGGGEAEEEAKDRVSEVPQRSCLLRNSRRSLSPLRRHSWGPGKNNGGDAEMNQRSSIRSPGEGKPTFHRRSYSLEGLTGVQEELRGGPVMQGPRILEPRQDSLDRGSLVSLTEEQEDPVENHRMHDLKSRRYRPLRNSCPQMSLPLTKSVSMLAISQRDTDGMRSFSSASGSVAYSISEEEPGPLRTDTEGKGVTKVSRTFSYIKNKMYKKTREKDREKKEKEKDAREKDKKAINGHLFTAISSGQATQCSQCNKTFNNKECFHCSHCNFSVHKSCRDSLPACAKVKMKPPKQQCAVPDSSSLPAVTMRNKCGGTKERPWSAILSPEEHSSFTLPPPRRATTIMAFHGNNLSKSLSISNIAGPVFEEMPIKGLRYLSQSTDSLNRTNQVTESMESLTDEGTEMMDGQLMGEFEAEVKELEADSWSLGVEQQFLQQLDKELVKRQDVIYELMQTEMHHIRTLRIMSEVYSKGLQKELQMDVPTVEKLFPVLDDLMDFHTQHLLRLFERKRESQLEGRGPDGGFIINRIGDILVTQFSGSNGETMKRVYERFCSRHNEAVNFYKDLMTKDKRFKAFIKKKMSSTIVRRLGIPECILLVTQRITKYPVLLQRMLQHTRETEEDFDDLTDSIRLLKDVIVAVDSKVNEHEKKRRLKDFHGRMDSKSIMMMKSGQIFARQDLLRRRLIHDGVLQLKSSQGRLKEVHALLLSDVFVFLQEKDQRFVFAMLDQRSTVISLQKLIVREVANEERGLFLITAGIEKPEMMEVLASSKDERNTWMQLIQDAMQSMDRDEDEGLPSETEDDKRQLETKTKEMRDQLRRKDAEIVSLLEEKVQLFRGMWEGLSPAGEEVSRPAESFFRSACSQELPRGASIMKDALQEVETLQGLVNGSLGGVMASIQEGGAGAGTVCLPRRAETFGGFDSHQMHSSKGGDRDESDDTVGDLRRTESDSVLKKGGNANFLQLLKRNSEQVLQSVSTLHLLLTTLQAVVIQQDSFMEDQRQALSERSSSCSSLSRQQSSRPSSLIEQEKQRSLEKQRQELASLQRRQAAHAEEKRRREREWELKEQQLSEREGLLRLQEGELQKQQGELEEERQEVQRRKEEYQRDLERLRDAQRRLERDKDAVQRQLDKMEEARVAERTPSTTSDEFQFAGGPRSLELEPFELSSSSSSSLSSASQSKLQPQRSKNKGKSLNPFAVSSSSSSNPLLKGSEANNQIPKNLLQLAKNKGKEGKEKKKKKGKGGSAPTSDSQHLPDPPLDGEIFFC